MGVEPFLVSSSGSGLDERGVTVFDLHGSAAGPQALGGGSRDARVRDISDDRDDEILELALVLTDR